MPRIRNEFLQCVLYLYPSEAEAEDGAHAGGSGFWVGYGFEHASGTWNLVYAVTNKHVVKSGNTVIRLSKTDGTIDVIPTLESDWAFHPAGDDVAVLFQSSLHKINLGQHSFNYVGVGAFISKPIISSMDIGPGDAAFIVGRFVNHEGRQKNLPTARFGAISQMPWEPIAQDTGFMQESFLVEARSIGGYSGSPVFVEIPRWDSGHGRVNTNWGYGPWLLGVDWGHINDWTPVCNKQGRPMNPDPSTAQVKINTGMTAVVPAWKILDILDCPAFLDQRRIAMEQMETAEFETVQALKPLS